MIFLYRESQSGARILEEAHLLFMSRQTSDDGRKSLLAAFFLSVRA